MCRCLCFVCGYVQIGLSRPLSLFFSFSLTHTTLTIKLLQSIFVWIFITVSPPINELPLRNQYEYRAIVHANNTAYKWYQWTHEYNVCRTQTSHGERKRETKVNITVGKDIHDFFYYYLLIFIYFFYFYFIILCVCVASTFAIWFLSGQSFSVFTSFDCVRVCPFSSLHSCVGFFFATKNITWPHPKSGRGKKGSYTLLWRWPGLGQ